MILAGMKDDECAEGLHWVLVLGLMVKCVSMHLTSFLFVVKCTQNLRNDFIFLGTRTNFRACIRKVVGPVTQRLLVSQEPLTQRGRSSLPGN